MNLLKTYLPVVTATLLLTACGGGSSSDSGPQTVTGQFIDAAVSGLAYNCSSGSSGVTNANGEYTCNVGDTVRFSINGFVLGEVAAKSVVTPHDITDNAGESTNVAQLLQTLDSDGDPSNGITIAQEGTLFDEVGELATQNISLSQSDFDTAVDAILSETLVGEAEADAHLSESLTRTAISGRKLYPQQDSREYREEFSVSADGNSGVIVGVDAEGAYTDHPSITYSGNTLTLTNQDVDDDDYGQPNVFTVTEITSTRITLESDGESIYVYYSQEDAYTGLGGGTSGISETDIRTAIASRKIYIQQSSRDYTEEFSVSADGNSGVIVGIDADGAYTDQIAITYGGNTLTLTVQGDDPLVFTVTEITSTRLTLEAGGESIYVYYSQEDAYSGIN